MCGGGGNKDSWLLDGMGCEEEEDDAKERFPLETFPSYKSLCLIRVT